MDWEGGGGFINDSHVEDGHQVAGSVSVGGDDKNKSIAAVSVSQISKLTRPNEGLSIHGKKIYHINMVAYVYEILDINPQKIHLMIDDYSGNGPLEVSHIIGDTGTPGDDPSLAMFSDHMAPVETDQERDIQTLRAGDYIRCIGVVKYTQERPNVVAYSLRIIDDPNEITMHIMEVVRDSLFYQKLQAGDGALPAMRNDKALPMQQQVDNSSKGDFGKLSTRDKFVINFLKREVKDDRGIHIDVICSKISAFDKREILEALNHLSNEGLCWQSDDEDIWCVS